MVLVRHRPGRAERTARTVHLVPLPTGTPPGAVSALCGLLLAPEDIVQVTPGTGMPCTVCLTSNLSGAPPETGAGDSSAGDTLLLPPTATRAGPLTWVSPPGATTLRHCREVDVVAALRTALGEPPPDAPTAF